MACPSARCASAACCARSASPINPTPDPATSSWCTWASPSGPSTARRPHGRGRRCGRSASSRTSWRRAMEYLDEYRDASVAETFVRAIRRESTRPWVIMEVCGGQTHSLLRYGVDRLLEGTVELVHGPGCPVCVTALETIDKAHAIAQRPEVIFTSFADMLRVPGSSGDLLALKARGADVRIVYSPMDALALARKHPDREVVFFGIGFETTAPANAMALMAAKRMGVSNFSMLVSHVLVPPSIAYIAQAADNRVQAFLGPGHVCAVTGFRAYHALSLRYRVPIVIAGFEPVDLLRALLCAVRQLERGEARVENAYERSVAP